MDCSPSGSSIPGSLLTQLSHVAGGLKVPSLWTVTLLELHSIPIILWLYANYTLYLVLTFTWYLTFIFIWHTLLRPPLKVFLFLRYRRKVMVQCTKANGSSYWGARLPDLIPCHLIPARDPARNNARGEGTQDPYATDLYHGPLTARPHLYDLPDSSWSGPQLLRTCACWVSCLPAGD